jgi:hypothetical protein
MSTDLNPAEQFNMLAQPRGPYRLSPVEFLAMPVSALQMERRISIKRLEESLWTVDLAGTGYERITPEHEIAQPGHFLTPGIYVRVLRMRAGLRVVGKRHAQEHVSIISCGRATVITEEGLQVIAGPCEFVSPAGTKRVVHVHEDMVWTTIHRTDKTDLAEIEAELILPELELEMLS